jgi:cyclin-dependent kinase-like
MNCGSAKQNFTEYVSTRWYRAPELLVESKHYDRSVDIWAVGCILPELITGKPLFPGTSNFETLAYVLKTMGNHLTKEQIESFNRNPQLTNKGTVKVILKFKFE